MRSALSSHVQHHTAFVRTGQRHSTQHIMRSHCRSIDVEPGRRYNNNSAAGEDSRSGTTSLKSVADIPPDGTSPIRKNTRQRHRFNKIKNISMDEIPSFHDFQRSMQIRTLYRQYTRLIGLYNRQKRNNMPTTAAGAAAVAATAATPLTRQQQVELQNQVRTEFKHHHNSNHTNDVFYIQKSLAEGQRRYKELYLMIHGSSPTVTTTTTTASSSPTAAVSPSPTHDTTTTTTAVPTSSSSSLPPPTATKEYWPWNKSREETTNTIPHSTHPSFPWKFPPKSNI